MYSRISSFVEELLSLSRLKKSARPCEDPMPSPSSYSCRTTASSTMFLRRRRRPCCTAILEREREQNTTQRLSEDRGERTSAKHTTRTSRTSRAGENSNTAPAEYI